MCCLKLHEHGVFIFISSTVICDTDLLVEQLELGLPLCLAWCMSSPNNSFKNTHMELQQR